APAGSDEGGQHIQKLNERLRGADPPQRQYQDARGRNSRREFDLTRKQQCDIESEHGEAQEINGEPAHELVRDVLVYSERIEPPQLWPEEAMYVEGLACNADLAPELLAARCDRLFEGPCVTCLDDAVALHQNHQRDRK